MTYNSVKSILKEDATANGDLEEKWDKCIEHLGEGGMLNELYRALSDDEILGTLKWIDSQHGFGLFDEEDDEEF